MDRIEPQNEDDRPELADMEEVIARGVADGRIRTFLEPDLGQLVIFKPGMTVANPRDVRRN